MSIGVSNTTLSNVTSAGARAKQNALQTSVTRLASGKRIASAVDDPAGLAMAEGLQAQVDGYDQAAANVQAGSNATTVASSALQSTSDILQQLRTLAVAASSDTATASDKANLQTEAAGLLAEIDSIAQTANFNGVSLLSGSGSASSTSSAATAEIATNASLASTSTTLGLGYDQSLLAASVSGAAASAGTIELQVVNTGASIAVQESFISAAGSSVAASLLSPNATSTVFDNVAVTTGNFTSADVGATAYISVTATNASPATLSTQTGSDEGSTIATSISGTSTQALGISAINLPASAPTNASLGAQAAIGQIDAAIGAVSNAQVALGASAVSLQYAAANDDVGATNLQASESQIRDLNVSAQSVRNSADQILSAFTTAVQVQSNLNARAVEKLFT